MKEYQLDYVKETLTDILNEKVRIIKLESVNDDKEIKIVFRSTIYICEMFECCIDNINPNVSSSIYPIETIINKVIEEMKVVFLKRYFYKCEEGEQYENMDEK